LSPAILLHIPLGKLKENDREIITFNNFTCFSLDAPSQYLFPEQYVKKKKKRKIQVLASIFLPL
jgi:hypothetical protein